MGFSEDERIRHKNRYHNEAYEIYENLKELGFSQKEIVDHCQLIMKTNSDPFRNEVYLRIIKLVEGLNENTNN